jgi:hypothetical protein
MYIALELEMPYGDDANDLPLRDMAEDMNRSLCWMIQPQASAVPKFDYEEVNEALTKGGAPCCEDMDELACWTMDLDAELKTIAKTVGRPLPTAPAADGPAQFIPKSHTLKARACVSICSWFDGVQKELLSKDLLSPNSKKELLSPNSKKSPRPLTVTSPGPSKDLAVLLPPCTATKIARLVPTEPEAEIHASSSTAVGSTSLPPAPEAAVTLLNQPMPPETGSPPPAIPRKVAGASASEAHNGDMVAKRLAWREAANPPKEATAETVKDESRPLPQAAG